MLQMHGIYKAIYGFVACIHSDQYDHCVCSSIVTNLKQMLSMAFCSHVTYYIAACDAIQEALQAPFS